jgi:hypothetical protein
VPPKDGEFVLVKQITTSASLKRALQPGDTIEFELGVFLAGPQGAALGRFNYYSEAMVYQVGKGGLQPWYRGPCCNRAVIPWRSQGLPDSALRGGAMMTLQENTSNNPEMNFLQAGKTGPKFQQAACIQCHLGNGKSTPVLGQPLTTMQVLTADVDANGALVPDARFGGRLSQGLHRCRQKF